MSEYVRFYVVPTGHKPYKPRRSQSRRWQKKRHRMFMQKLLSGKIKIGGIVTYMIQDGKEYAIIPAGEYEERKSHL